MFSLVCLLFCMLPALIPFAAKAATHGASQPTAVFADVLKDFRVTETRAHAPERPGEDALIMAECAAHAKAMHTAMRALIALPEVRIAGAVGTLPSLLPDLLTLAHATVKTKVLLVSRSKKNGTVTVTVAVDEGNSIPELGERVRAALLHPERLALHKETAQRQAALLADYDAIMARSVRNGGIPLSYVSLNELAAIVREVKALALYATVLPLRGNIWREPAAVRDAVTRGLALAPDSALLHNALGDLFLQDGRSQEAVEEQTKAIRAIPTFARAYQSRGAAFMALGHLSSAVADFSEAIRLAPHTASVYHDRGMARRLLGEWNAMCRDFYDACVLGACERYHQAAAEGLCAISKE